MGYRSDREGEIFLKSTINRGDFEYFCKKEGFKIEFVPSEKDEIPELICFRIYFNDWKCLCYHGKSYWNIFRELALYGDFSFETRAEDGEIVGRIYNAGNDVYCHYGHSVIVYDTRPTKMEG